MTNGFMDYIFSGNRWSMTAGTRPPTGGRWPFRDQRTLRHAGPRAQQGEYSPRWAACVSPDEKGVGAAFLADGGRRTVAGINFYIVAQRQELAADRIQELIKVAPREVSPANRASK